MKQSHNLQTGYRVASPRKVFENLVEIEQIMMRKLTK